MLTKEAVEEFQKIYKKVYGKDIPYAEAEQKADALLDILSTVAGQPLPFERRRVYDAE